MGDGKNSKKVKKGKEGYESLKCDNTNEYVLLPRRNTQRRKSKKLGKTDIIQRGVQTQKC